MLGREVIMNNENATNKRWLLLFAALIMLYFSLKDFDFAQLEKLAFQDVLPILVLTSIIILFKTSILSVILLSIQKIWRKCTNRG